MENFTELSRGVRGPELPVLVEAGQPELVQQFAPECTYQDGEIKVMGTAGHVSECVRSHFAGIRRRDGHGLCRYGMKWLLVLAAFVLVTFYGADLSELRELFLLI